VLKDLKMTGVPGATRAEMKFILDSLLAFTNNRMGIFTEDPQHEIDLNGNVNIGKNLLLAGNGGQAGQVLRSNGSAGPPSWQNLPGEIDIDTILFKANSNVFSLAANTTANVTNTIEKYDIGAVHTPATGIANLPVEGFYQFTARCSFSTETAETGPFILKVLLEIVNADNSPVETIEQSTVLPGGMNMHTSQVQLHSQVKIQTGQKVRVKVANTKPTGSGAINARLDEFSGVLL